MNKSINKDTSVETLRGFAIVLVVIGHVIGSGADGGMKVEEDSFLRYFYFTFQYLRMPLFTVISGWVYALRPATKTNLLDFNVKKIRRLLLPLLFVGGTYYILQSIIPGTNFSYELKDIWRLLVYPYTFYWYLQSLFLVFIVISVLDAGAKLNSFKNWIVFFILSLVFLFVRDAFIPESSANVYGYKGAMYLLPFFAIGVGIKRFKQQFDNKYFVWANAIVLIAGLIFQQLVGVNVIDYDLSNSSGVGLLIGVAGVMVCLRIHFTIKSMVWIGGYAYTIFLFHSFGTSGGRILLNKVGIESTPVVFAVSLFMGLFLPIIAEEILDHFSLTRLLFLGRAFKMPTPQKRHTFKLNFISNK